MSRLCRLKTASHGDDGKWAYNEIVSLRKQRDELLAVAEHIQRCIPYGGFCQIHHGSATAADLDAAIASVKESK